MRRVAGELHEVRADSVAEHDTRENASAIDAAKQRAPSGRSGRLAAQRTTTTGHRLGACRLSYLGMPCPAIAVTHLPLDSTAAERSMTNGSGTNFDPEARTHTYTRLTWSESVLND